MQVRIVVPGVKRGWGLVGQHLAKLRDSKQPLQAAQPGRGRVRSLQAWSPVWKSAGLKAKAEEPTAVSSSLFQPRSPDQDTNILKDLKEHRAV